MLNDFRPKNGLKCFKMFISALAAQGPELIKTFLEYSDWLKMFNSQSECIKRSIYAPINRYRIGPGKSLSRTFVITLQYTLVVANKHGSYKARQMLIIFLCYHLGSDSFLKKINKWASPGLFFLYFRLFNTVHLKTHPPFPCALSQWSV